MILKGKAIYKMEVSPLHISTLGSEFGNTELTFQFKDGHVEVIQLGNWSQKTTSYETLQAFADECFSGDLFLLNQSMKKDFTKLYNELLIGLEEKMIDTSEIVDIFYMDM